MPSMPLGPLALVMFEEAGVEVEPQASMLVRNVPVRHLSETCDRLSIQTLSPTLYSLDKLLFHLTY